MKCVHSDPICKACELLNYIALNADAMLDPRWRHVAEVVLNEVKQYVKENINGSNDSNL